MDKLISLYQDLQSSGVLFFTWHLDEGKAAIIEHHGQYGIFMDFDSIPTRAEEITVVAHEGGHAATGSTHALCSPYDLIAKHERCADKWAIKKLIPEDELKGAMADGYTEIWSLAEHFNVTEDFMRKAVCWYEHGNLAVEEYMCF